MGDDGAPTTTTAPVDGPDLSFQQMTTTTQAYSSSSSSVMATTTSPSPADQSSAGPGLFSMIAVNLVNLIHLALLVAALAVQLLAHIVVSRRHPSQFHANMVALLRLLNTMWALSLVTKGAVIVIELFCYQGMLFSGFMVILDGPIQLMYLDSIFAGTAFASLVTLFFLVSERVFASLYFRDYEFRIHTKMLMLSAGGTSLACGAGTAYLVLFHVFNPTSSISSTGLTILLVMMIIIFGVGIAMHILLSWMRRYNERQRLKMLDGSFRRYTLGQRLQMNENIRTAMMLQRFMTVVSSIAILIALIMMAEWVLANLMHLDVKAVYVTIRYVFDFTFPLGTLPAMAIMGTATPRCRDTFFKLLHRVLLYCPFYSGARRIGQAPTNNNSLGSGRPDEADQPREMVVVSGQPWATANVRQGDLPAARLRHRSSLPPVQPSPHQLVSPAAEHHEEEVAVVQQQVPLLQDASGRPMGGFSAAKETAIYFEQLAHAWNV